MGVPKPTENTVTAFLKDELEKLGVKTIPFASLNTPAGRREVDILCENGGLYPIEAKFTESELLNAIAKIQNDYLKYHKVLGIKGGFAILYPDKLAKPIPIETLKSLLVTLKFKVVMMFLPEDKRRNFTVIEGTLTEIAKEISKQILTPPEYVELNVEWTIRSLREAAEYITIGLKHLAGKALEDIFGGEHVFRNILQYEEKEYPEEELRLASAYLLVNQLLFYHVLSKRIGLEEIDVDSINDPSELNRYFKKVADNINYKAIFSYDVASRIPSKYLEHIKTIINVIKGISPEKISGDLLGTIFHDLIPLEVRKYVAAYYTNVLAAELLAWLAIDKWDAKVADFACGSGGLLVAAYRRKKYLLELEGKTFSQDMHEKFIEQLLGVDVMPFAASIAASHLALQSPEYYTNKVNIAIWDSTELEPNRRIPSIASLRFVLKGQANLDMFAKEGNVLRKGVVRLRDEEPEEIILTKYDVVIMNPPFTRQERIPEEYKQVLFDRFKDYEEYLHGQLGYHGYFILLADKFLEEGGKMALVLPATVLRLKSFEGIRRLLAEKYHVEYIITTYYRSAFSESTHFREILLVAKKDTKGKKTKIIILKKLPKTLNEAREIADLLRDIDGNYEDDRIIVNCIESKKLQTTRNWFGFISVKDQELVDVFEIVAKSGKLDTFSSVIERVIRGFELEGGKVTKLIINLSKERAIKSKDIWILENDLKDKIKFRHKVIDISFEVPKNVVRRTIRRSAGVRKIEVTNELDYIIVGKWKDFEDFKEIAGVKLSDEELNKIRNAVERRIGNLHILWRFDVSAPGTCILAFYTFDKCSPTKMFWSLDIPDDDAKILALYLNSTINLLQILLLRVETRGAFVEIFKYILEDFLVLNPKKLSKSEKDLILKTFEDVKDVELPSILEQLKTKHPIRKEIDESILKVLGVEIDLDSLYDRIAQEIELLRSLMSEGKG